MTSSPDQDSKISEEELRYIQASLQMNTKERVEKEPVPWKSIASSKAVLAICMSNICENWGFYTFLTQLPKYLKGNTNFLLLFIFNSFKGLLICQRKPEMLSIGRAMAQFLKCILLLFYLLF